MKFADLNLKPEVLKSIKDKGYTDLTPIQESTLPVVLSGKDMIALAETGSGKTAACAIPLIQNVDPAVKAVQVLVLVPTRELALQYVSEISSLAKHSDIAAFAVYGGFSIDIQKGKLDHGVQILVATPGRLIDLLYNSPLSLSQVTTFVLDEADVMLDMGFIGDVEFVFSCLIHNHQTLLFSATMPAQIKSLTSKYLNDPVCIELNIDQIAPQSLDHWFYQVNIRDRVQKLLDYLKDEKPSQAIIFCNSRTSVERLFKDLRKTVDSVEVIHGGHDQSKRSSLFRRFRDNKIKIIIATDVAGRGLDFSHVSHVINFDFPNNPETYTHRTGRTARMGREGKAVTLFTKGCMRNLKRLVKTNNISPKYVGNVPDLDNISSGKSTGRGKKSFSHKRPRRKTSTPKRS